MVAAAEKLAASPYYQHHGGRNHIWGTTASTIDGARLNDRLGKQLAPLMRWTVAGRYKPFKQHNFDSGSTGGKCVIQLPFPALAAAAFAFPSAKVRSSPDGHRRATLLFFAGAVDGICCTGAVVRCAVAELWGMTHGQLEHADIVIRSSRRKSGAPQPCLEKARRKYSHTLGGRVAEEAAVVTPPSGEEGLSTSMAARATRSVAGRTGKAYGASVFCLAPAGDTCVSSRINSALAAGCIPVLLCDEWPGAFSDVVPYEEIIVRLDVAEFLRDPAYVLRALRAMPQQEVARRQRALALYRADITWEARGSRVADNLLNVAASRCLPAMEAAEKVVVCAARTARRAVRNGHDRGDTWHRGFCRETIPDAEGNCSAVGSLGALGSWELGNRTQIQTLEDCKRACSCCASCRFISFSAHRKHRECSW